MPVRAVSWLVSLMGIFTLLALRACDAGSNYWWTFNHLNVNAADDDFDDDLISAAYNANPSNGDDSTAVVVWSSIGNTQITSKLIARKLNAWPQAWGGQIDDYWEEKTVFASESSASPQWYDNAVATNQRETWVIAFSNGTSGDSDILFVRSTDNAETWSTHAVLDSFARLESQTDLGVQLIFDQRVNRFTAAWLSKQTRNGTGSDYDILLSASDDDGVIWSSPVWVNAFAANDSVDESNIRLTLAPGSGCIHIFYQSSDPHGTLDAGTDGDIFFRSTCDSGSTFSATRTVHPASMQNAANLDKDTSFDACTDLNGTSLVVIYRTEAGGASLERTVRGIASSDGGATFLAPETINSVIDATEVKSAPTCKTDSRGLFITVFSSRQTDSITWESDYHPDDAFNPDYFVDTGKDPDLYFSFASTRPGAVPGTGWTVPMVTDDSNSQRTGSHDSPVLIHDSYESWVVMSTSTQVTVDEDDVFGPDKDIMFQPFHRLTDKVCWNNGPGLTSYCFSGLQEKINFLPENMTDEVPLPVFGGSFWRGGVTAKEAERSAVVISKGRKVRIVKTQNNGGYTDFKAWGFSECSFPYFIVDDAISSFRADFNTEGIEEIENSFLVWNRGNSPNVFILHDTVSGYHLCHDSDVHTRCPIGYRPPEPGDGINYFPKYCVPCPAGRFCGNQTQFLNSSSPMRLCPAGRFCGPGTFDPELSRCDVFRYYTSADVGMQSRDDCRVRGTPCEFGFWCSPGTLETDYVRILANTTTESLIVSETLVYPGSRELDLSFDRTVNLIRPLNYTSETQCYLSPVSTCDYEINRCVDADGSCTDNPYICTTGNVIALPSAFAGYTCSKHVYMDFSIGDPPAWLSVRLGVDGESDPFLRRPGDNLSVAFTLLSTAVGVSISDVVRTKFDIEFLSLWETFPYSRSVMLPVPVDITRAVTTVIFNPSDRIDIKKSIADPAFTANATMFNIGCEDSVTWEAMMWDCDRPDVPTPTIDQNITLYPLAWASTVSPFNSGFIDVGVTDPAVITFRVNISKVDPERAVRNAGLKTYRACLRVEFSLSQSTTTVLKKDLDVVMNLFEECEPGTYSDIGTSENAPCSPCEAGTYTDSVGSTICRACPESFPRSKVGAKSISECRAAPGYFRDTDNSSLSCSRLGNGVSCLDEGLTIESVRLLSGYWRSGSKSKAVLRCPNQLYCVGGVHGQTYGGTDANGTNSTTGGVGRRRILSASELSEAESYCYPHHRGPYCQLCHPGYVKRGTNPCSICDSAAYKSDQQRLGWTILAACILILVAFLITQRGRLRRLARRRAQSIVGLAKGHLPGHHHSGAAPPAIRGSNGAALIASGAFEESGGFASPTPRGETSSAINVAVSSSRESDSTLAAATLNDKRLNRARSLARTLSKRFRPISAKIDKRATLLWSVIVSIEASTTLRILVSLFQVIGGVSKNFGDIYPEIFSQIASAFNALSAEIFYNIDFACVIYTNHYLSLILGMISPALAILLLLAVHFVFERRLKQVRRFEDIPRLRSGTYSLFLVLLFLIYPSVSSTILATFVCKSFDDGSRWLRKDITINCDAPERTGWLVLASFGVIIYVVGVPLVYLVSLVRVRRLIDPVDKNEQPDKTKFSHVLFLTEIYKRNLWFWEVVELIRKLLQTSLVIFFLDGSVMQMIVMIIIAMIMVQIINELQPYVNPGANKLASVAQWEILIVSFIGLLLRVDLGSLDTNFAYNKNELLTGFLVAGCFMAPLFAVFQKRVWLYHKFVDTRCFTRKAPKKHDETEETPESALLSALVSPWASSSSFRGSYSEKRDGSKETIPRDSSSGGMVENPIATLEKQASIRPPVSPKGATLSSSPQQPSNRMVSFVVE